MTEPLNVDPYGLRHMAAEAQEQAAYVSGVAESPPTTGAVGQRTAAACNTIHEVVRSTGVAMSQRLTMTADASLAAAERYEQTDTKEAADVDHTMPP